MDREQIKARAEAAEAVCKAMVLWRNDSDPDMQHEAWDCLATWESHARTDIPALFAAIDELEALGTELAAALRKHRADMHNTSNRPCPTCRQSAKALAAWDARPCETVREVEHE
jgi:hypothetical protein